VNPGMPSLMLSFPLICLALFALTDFGMAFLRRKRLANFAGGANRFYSAVMIAALIRSAVFSLLFVPALALYAGVTGAYHFGQLEQSLLMVLPPLFAAVFATRLERHVFEMLESALLRDRAAFLSVSAKRVRRPKVGV
jgi:hypothetical protein